MNAPEDKCLLKLLGITYNQIESGVYAMILREEDDEHRHIPIIVGFAEAQSIECKLQEVVTPRPLTHDLMANMLQQFGITLTEVNIIRLPSGVFAAEMKLRGSDGHIHSIDARSSDAVALAIRVNAPIYTTRQVLDEVGYLPGNKPQRHQQSRVSTPSPSVKPKKAMNQTFSSTIEVAPFEGLTLTELQTKMEQAAENEDYELAARFKEEIDRRKNENY